jgi:putative sigma-54 modulation protein
LEITIKGRHWKPTSSFRVYAVERIERLTRFYPKLIRADLVVTQEGYRHHAELRLHGNSVDSLAKAVDVDARTSFDMVLEKQERALRRHKDKMKDRKKRGATLRVEPAPVEAPALPRTSRPEVELVRMRPTRPVLSAEEAARALLKSKKPVLVFEERGEEEGLRVAYRLADGQVGLLELD